MSPVMATGRALPPEVVDHILDGLASGDSLTVSDQKNLANCCLVCRAWLPRSSAHLLKSIAVPAQDLERYLTFAKASVRLATHVQEFTLSGSVNVIRYLEAMFSIMPRLNHLELLNNLTPFERLMVPAYHTANPMSLNPAQRSPHADNISSVVPNDRFTLSYLKMDHVQPASLAELLRSFNQIETLEFRSVVGEEEYQGLDGSHVLFGHVKHFCTELLPHLLPVTSTVKSMIFAGNSAVAGMIVFLSIQPSTTITLSNVFPKNMRHVLGFLDDVGCEVGHVKLLPAKTTANPRGIQVNWNIEDVEGGVRVRDKICPKLQTLELSIENIELTTIGFSNILCRLPSTMLRLRIILHLGQLPAILDTIRLVIGSDAQYRNLQSIQLCGPRDGEPLPSEHCLVSSAARLPKHLSSIVQIM